MNIGKWLAYILLFSLLTACGRPQPESDSRPENAAEKVERPVDPGAAAEPVEIIPGLRMRITKTGDGEVAQPGQTAVVHYTGWLYDTGAPGDRGQKFDSSVDRGQHFEFPLGAGRVIRGWDAGVVGMRVGEVRELVIAPELAYGERGAGGVIPPDATLVFEVELADLKGEAAPLQ